MSDNRTKRAGILPRIVRRWLNRLGYNWQDVKKGVYLDGHERADVEYLTQFLEAMKGLLPFFVDFAEDGSI
jgi:hypothetical protein